jgi:hypothetical protein
MAEPGNTRVRRGEGICSPCLDFISPNGACRNIQGEAVGGTCGCLGSGAAGGPDHPAAARFRLARGNRAAFASSSSRCWEMRWWKASATHLRSDPGADTKSDVFTTFAIAPTRYTAGAGAAAGVVELADARHSKCRSRSECRFDSDRLSDRVPLLARRIPAGGLSKCQALRWTPVAPAAVVHIVPEFICRVSGGTS